VANAQVVTALLCIDKERLGYQAISLTHAADNVAPAIAAGSKVEIGGALFDITGDEAITDGGIANSSQVYFYLHVSGASFTASGSITTPTWDTAKQGWYNGTDRAIGGCSKDSGGNYTLKWLYEDKQVDSIRRFLDGSTGMVPIGAIVAWHKSLPGVPALPANFVQCDGQVLSDASSPMNGQTIPNLNGLGHFLRGAAVSGTVQAQGTKRPTTPFTGTGTFTGNTTAGSIVNLSETTAGTPAALPGVNVTIDGGGDAETRPVNMSVVWIMRVK
jgi:hypothetical protein